MCACVSYTRYREVMQIMILGNSKIISIFRDLRNVAISMTSIHRSAAFIHLNSCVQTISYWRLTRNNCDRSIRVWIWTYTYEVDASYGGWHRWIEDRGSGRKE